MKTINGFQNCLVNRSGEVFSTAGKGKWLKQQNHKQGYKFVNLLCDDGKFRMTTVHKVVALAYLPNPKNKPDIIHRNGVNSDNRAANLKWATSLEVAGKRWGCSNTGKIAINNGSETKWIPRTDPIPSGFTRGKKKK